MKRKMLVLSFSLIILLSLLGCQNKKDSAAMKVDSNHKEYYGEYYKIKTGELDGDYFDDFEAVPLESYEGDNTITLKSNGIYESTYNYYSESDGTMYRSETNKYEYKFKGNEIIRKREITPENFKSFTKIAKDEYGDLRVQESYVEKIENEYASVIKDEEDYLIYDITDYKISISESDLEDNHLEYDYINAEGEMISINYYYDDDRTVVSIFRKDF